MKRVDAGPDLVGRDVDSDDAKPSTLMRTSEVAFHRPSAVPCVVLRFVLKAPLHTPHPHTHRGDTPGKTERRRPPLDSRLDVSQMGGFCNRFGFPSFPVKTSFHCCQIQTGNSSCKATTRHQPRALPPRTRAMEFFEGKRVRELRGTYEDALEQTLTPQSLEVRPAFRGPTRSAPRITPEKGDEGDNSISPAVRSECHGLERHSQTTRSTFPDIPPSNPT